ncbi:MYND finger domain-like protein [Strigomonas culicis]|uniref:MYND finger domain-like protein n=1 Tax=Strigomonas culicis TaxID=28005 RepID=S9UKZ4_9TRYP|nr:MYND finger domain-like protein [Strigomonas culicis]|eukprot:EPY29578.1 MYND finger domain-like protein [Strigomonas culicis]
MLHTYHAEIGDKTFQFSLELPTPITEATFQMEVAKAVEEVSESMLSHLSDEDKMCVVCKKVPAARLTHHPMLFSEAFPPRIEDIPQQVCASPECAVLAEAQYMMDMEIATTAQGQPGLGKCFKCGTRAAPGTALMRCSRCKVAKYCSAECQKSDWKFHKQVCASAA